MKTETMLEGVIAYLEQRKSDIEYHAERIAGWDKETEEEFKDLNNMIANLKKLKGVI